MFVGGFLGTGLRAAAGLLDGPWLAGVNLVGAFGLGLLVGMRPAREVRLLLGTGLLGAFTTYSALALALPTTVSAGMEGLVSVVLGPACAALGLWAGSRRWAG